MQKCFSGAQKFKNKEKSSKEKGLAQIINTGEEYWKKKRERYFLGFCQ